MILTFWWHKGREWALHVLLHLDSKLLEDETYISSLQRNFVRHSQFMGAFFVHLNVHSITTRLEVERSRDLFHNSFYGCTFIQVIQPFFLFQYFFSYHWFLKITHNFWEKCSYTRKDYLGKMQQHSARCHCCRVCILEGRWTLYCISFISKLLPKKSIVVAQHLHQTNISNILSVVGRLEVGIVFESKEMFCCFLAFSNYHFIFAKHLSFSR